MLILCEDGSTVLNSDKVARYVIRHNKKQSGEDVYSVIAENESLIFMGKLAEFDSEEKAKEFMPKLMTMAAAFCGNSFHVLDATVIKSLL